MTHPPLVYLWLAVLALALVVLAVGGLCWWLRDKTDDEKDNY